MNGHVGEQMRVYVAYASPHNLMPPDEAQYFVIGRCSQPWQCLQHFQQCLAFIQIAASQFTNYVGLGTNQIGLE